MLCGKESLGRGLCLFCHALNDSLLDQCRRAAARIALATVGALTNYFHIVFRKEHVKPTTPTERVPLPELLPPALQCDSSQLLILRERFGLPADAYKP